jgi:hypothetical protein
MVVAAASDPISVAAAHAVGTQIAIIGARTVATNAMAAQAAARLHVNATDYTAQEQANASGLLLGGAPAAADPGAGAVLPIPALTPALPGPQSAVAPTSGKHIAQLIHNGPGAEPLRAAAERLRRHADQLRDSSLELRSGALHLESSWFSGASATAKRRIRELADWYQQQASNAQSAAEHAAAQGDNVSRARSAIPTPEQFESVESRLKTAVRANTQSRGAYSAVVAALQSQLGLIAAPTGVVAFIGGMTAAGTAISDISQCEPPG